MSSLPFLVALLLLTTGGAQAQNSGLATDPDIDIDLHGYLQGGLARTPGDLGSADGGHGKLGLGGADPRLQPTFGGGLLEATAGLPLDLSALVDLSFDPRQKSTLDLFQASLRWAPQASGSWRWSGKLGAFFPPFGLENRDIGWSSPWTLTPSALSGWVGQELRTIGSEGTIGWRNANNSLAVTAAVYGWNDLSGRALATRGWDLGQSPIGLFDHIRLPNAPNPRYTAEFKEIDDSPGWYAGLSWQNPTLGTLQFYRYDNDADLDRERNDVYAWRTRFWEAGYTKGLGAFYLIAEGMAGDTRVSPDGAGPFVTDFHTAYLLGGWTHDDWRTALRIEQFGTSGGAAEHGRSATASVNYAPEDWLRLTAEITVVDSTSDARAAAHLTPRAIDTEPQIGARLSF